MANDRINFYYDPAREGYDTTLWKTISGVPAVASSKIRLNAAEIIGYADFFKAETSYKLNIPAAPVSATLVSGAAATSDYLIWAAVSDGEFTCTIDGTSRDITGLDFSAATTMPEIASVIQTGIRAVTGATETCTWSSTLTGGAAATSVPATWAAVTDGEFAVTIDDTGIEVAGIDFTGVTTMAEVAAIIQTELRAETGGTETVVWSTDHFVITALNNITVLSTVVAPAGTDISGAGATTFMDSEVGVGTASNRFTITSTTGITVASAVGGGGGTDISGAGATAFLDADVGHGTATQGSDREFGFKQYAEGSKLTFKISGANFTAECLNESTSSSTSLTWDTSWNATDTLFTIKWTGFSAEFLVNGMRFAFITDMSVPKKALSQSIRNSGADNLDITYLQANNVQGYI